MSLAPILQQLMAGARVIRGSDSGRSPAAGTRAGLLLLLLGACLRAYTKVPSPTRGEG